ncbi:MAG TPA: T3SS effector HopA1 family protein [Bryobacteraceae bacterium]|nr:T3SS effector HopA1 family protein [Bryobacteraceae bacterium]
MSTIRTELSRILDAISIVSPALFSFRGEPVPVTPGPVQPLPGFPNHPLPQMPLARDLQATLYSRCYAQRIEDPQPAKAAVFTLDPSFAASLSANNRTQSRWEGGWSVYAVAPSGQVSLQKGDRQRFAVPGEFLSHGAPGMPPVAGTVVSVFVPRESAAAQPGFFFVYGETLSDVWDEHNLLRFYFHAAPEVAPDLLAYLTSALNHRLAPFKMKTLSEPALYPRTDAMVLYLAKRHYDSAVRVVREMPAEIGKRLGSSTPLFTLPLQAGVGCAEDPNTGESFGMNRCRLTAEGIVDAWRKGQNATDDRLNAIAGRFLQEGFDLDRPHLNPGSVELPEVPEKVDFAYA